jgi:hypothetical protein
MGLKAIVSKRLGSRYRSGRSPDWLKFKNPAAPAVKREAQEEWGSRRWSNGHALKLQRGLPPMASKTQKTLSLLFGPSPGGPPKAIARIRMIFVDRGLAPRRT